MADAPNPSQGSSSGAQTPPPSSNAPGVPASGASSQPSPSPEPQQPLEDWERRYSSLEREHNRYKSLGDPDQVQQALNWARQVAAEIQAGKLGYTQAQKEAAQAPQRDPYEGWDELDPRAQAQRLRDVTISEIREMLKPELEGLNKRYEDHTKTLTSQNQLFQQAMRLAVQHPEVPFDDIIAEATKLTTQSPQELLKTALDGLVAPKRQKAAIEQAVQEELARRQAEADKQKVEMLTPRRSPRLLRDTGKTPLERKQAEDAMLMEKVQKALRSA